MALKMKVFSSCINRIWQLGLSVCTFAEPYCNNQKWLSIKEDRSNQCVCVAGTVNFQDPNLINSGRPFPIKNTHFISSEIIFSFNLKIWWHKKILAGSCVVYIFVSRGQLICRPPSDVIRKPLSFNRVSQKVWICWTRCL